MKQFFVDWEFQYWPNKRNTKSGNLMPTNLDNARRSNIQQNREMVTADRPVTIDKFMSSVNVSHVSGNQIIHIELGFSKL